MVCKNKCCDRTSHIFQHLQNSEHCRALCSADCFHVLDHASTTFQLKVKEAIHIQREQSKISLILTLSRFALFLLLLLIAL